MTKTQEIVKNKLLKAQVQLDTNYALSNTMAVLLLYLQYKLLYIQ